MVFVFSEGYAVGAPSYATGGDANGSRETRRGSSTVSMIGTASAGGSQKDARPHKPRRPCGRALAQFRTSVLPSPGLALERRRERERLGQHHGAIVGDWVPVARLIDSYRGARPAHVGDRLRPA